MTVASEGGPFAPATGPRTLAPFGRRRATVTEVEVLGAYRLLWADDADGPADPQPGQFYMLATAGGWGAGRDERPYLPRAFSFARVRPRGSGAGAALGFLLEEVGPGTERLARLAPGEELWLAGPFGIGFSEPGTLRPVLVGGGIGIAPVLALSDALGPDAPVLLGFRSAAHAEAAALFGGLAGLATDDGSAGRRALVTELLEERLAEDPGSAAVRACGPPPMLEAVRRLCLERGAAAELALESGMACGYGACYGCVVPTREGYLRLCVDGPVVDAAQLATAAVAFGAGE
jgi:NAD(P)H-flavin reductase